MTPKFFQGSNGKAVLLIHGITSGAAQMIPMAKFLNDYGYSVWCVNLAGHGTFPQELLHTSCEDFIAKAEYDYKYLRKYFDTVYVGGLSTGGCLSLYLAANYPEISGIIPISVQLRLRKWVFGKISCPAIIIQAKDDAVADPLSASEIFGRILSEKKELYTPDNGEHNIVLI